MTQQYGIHLPPPVSFDSWPRRLHSGIYLSPGSALTDCLLDEREIAEYLYVIGWIPRHIVNAKPGDELDLLTEIQRIESLRRPLFEDLAIYFEFLGLEVGP